MSIETLGDAKAQAKALRVALGENGTVISHAQALELVARQNGAKDWNVLHARLAAAEPEIFRLGQEVRGSYLGQAFTGRIIALARPAGQFRLTIQFDTPVDTVRFEGFSNLRRRVSGTIGLDGRSVRKTSDGVPQLIVEISQRPG